MNERITVGKESLQIPSVQRVEWIKAGLRTLVLVVILSGVAWMFLVLAVGRFENAWPTGGIHIVVGISYLVAMTVLSRMTTDAHLYHAFYAAGAIPIVLPLLDGGARLLEMESINPWPIVATSLIGAILITWKEVTFTIDGLRVAQPPILRLTGFNRKMPLGILKLQCTFTNRSKVKSERTI